MISQDIPETTSIIHENYDKYISVFFLKFAVKTRNNVRILIKDNNGNPELLTFSALKKSSWTLSA